MKIVKILFFLIISTSQLSQAQTHWVVFTDKDGVEFDPYAYFDLKAIVRRENIGYDLYHITDFPVKEDYIVAVSNIADSISWTSRWMNAVSVWACEEQLLKMQMLPFVKEIIPIHQEEMQLCEVNTSQIKVDTSLWNNQLQRMELAVFQEAGIDGKGVRVAVFDGGFPGVDTHPAFQHIRTDNRIILTYDFVKKKEYVYDYNSHGTSVLSCIGGIFQGRPLGLATGSEFLLARTERNTEPYSEEVNWVAALEWADKNGADIVNSSLGYTYHRYFPYEMDGNTAFISIMANTAASKGILIVNAAGNDGDNSWNRIGAPADADSIISVGGIDPATDYRISFSSVGPTADLRRKPNVSAYGYVVVADPKELKHAYGTSFASPLVAGFAACTKQMYPEAQAMELKSLIEQSGHLYPFFDYAHGYGIPQASKIMNPWEEVTETTFTITSDDIQILITINEDQEILLNEPDKYRNYLFYSISDKNDIISEWGILKVNEYTLPFIRNQKYNSDSIFHFHFRGYTESFTR